MIDVFINPQEMDMIKCTKEASDNPKEYCCVSVLLPLGRFVQIQVLFFSWKLWLF